VIVLGIDPGTAALGYGLVDRTGGSLRAVDYGVVTTSPDLPLPERLLHIHAALTELIETHRPDLVGVERLFFSKNAQTAFGVGQARGVVLLAAAQAGIPVREATPNEIKMGVTGFGAADKEQVGRMVAVILGLDEVPTPDDTADALACAISIANAERPGDRVNAGTGAGRAAVMDRAAIAPIARGDTPYERAVREALAKEAAAMRTSPKDAPKPAVAKDRA
jgi:crossover junction endodeoxyribonuclease RuvC